MSKLSTISGTAAALTVFALTATVAWACPPKKTPPPCPPPSCAPCPPTPCGKCDCPVSASAAWISTDQHQGFSGKVHNVFMLQKTDTAVKVMVGDDIRAESHNEAVQEQTAKWASQGQQWQGTSGGASATGPANKFPGFWTAKTVGDSKQKQQMWGKDVEQIEEAFTWQQSRVDGVVSTADGSSIQEQEAGGSGDFWQKNALNGGTIAQWWAVPPFPKSHTFDFFLGNQTGHLFQTINLVNELIFG